jgi:vesicle-associated membrane protein 7
VLREQIEKYSGGGSSSSNEPDIEGMQGQLGNIKSVMVDNIDKVLDRGEKLSLLVDRSDNLHQQAFKFSKASTNFKRAMWLKNMKMAAMLGGLVLGVIYLFAATFCGGLLLRTCRRVQ